MRISQFAARAVIIMLLMFVALAASSCVNDMGVGMGAGSTARWGGGAGPPIFVGGPSFK